MFNITNSTILITGGTGSWGNELVTQLLQKYPNVKQIRIYSRNEHKQVEMWNKFNRDPKIKFIIGDIRDKDILNYAMYGVDIVFHLAALKHVPVCEDNSWESVLTNIVGTQNVIECAIKNKIKKVVDVSTDKAVDPFNIYGVTKACGEKLIINSNYNYFNNSDTSLICIRGGNVIGTNGSVVPLFKKQILENNEITVTDLSMTRYLMSTREAISLIFTAVENSIGGELFVMRMNGATVETMAKAMIKLFGNESTKINVVGARPGEKKHELLVSKNESPFTFELSEKYYVIIPQINDTNLTNKYQGLAKIEFEEFGSHNTYLYTPDELAAVLEKELWLFNK